MDISPRSRAPLLEIRRRTRLVKEAVDGLSYEAYLGDLQVQASVERHLEVIGEACRRLTDDELVIAERIEDLRTFIGLRNVIAHGYDRLVQETIWEAVTVDVATLDNQVSRLLDELGEPH